MKVKLIAMVALTTVIAVLVASALNSFTHISDSALADVATPYGGRSGRDNPAPTTAGKVYLPIFVLNSTMAGGAWLLAGNAGTNWNSDFLGTTDNMTLTFRVSNTIAYRIVPVASAWGFAPNIIGGAPTNQVGALAAGATIAGGGSSQFPNVIGTSGSYAFVGGGIGNSATQYASVIGGGNTNVASGYGSTVGGGEINTASGSDSIIAGGKNNSAGWSYSAVGGGQFNTASALYSTVGGGTHNTASSESTVVGGGSNNSAGNIYAAVSGGNSNSASGDTSFIGGGCCNHATSLFTSIGGGAGNTASGVTSTIAGGQSNIVQASGGMIGGGYRNMIPTTGTNSFIGGGNGNIASGLTSTIAGGQNNLVQANGGMIGGGYSNTISTIGYYAFIGGGVSNAASGNLDTVAGGGSNTASGGASFVGGGTYDAASGAFSTVGGGSANTANGYVGTIAGGWGNTASGSFDAVGGGQGNTATGYISAIGGGWQNTTSGNVSTISGGNLNNASGDYAFVGGGRNNSVVNTDATIGGGNHNTAGGTSSSVGGGANNNAGGNYAFVGGGANNIASGYVSSIAGGNTNVASGNYGSVGGGYFNTASGLYSTVPGGNSNQATMTGTLAAGSNARAVHEGSFVWADTAPAAFGSTWDDQFLIRASGGVGLNTNVPMGYLNVSSWGGGNWPQVYISQTTSSDYARLRFGVQGASTKWDIARGPWYKDVLNFYRDDIGNILSLMPDDLTDLVMMSNGAHLTKGGAWTNSSDKNVKANFEDVDVREILAKVSELPITTWNYKAEPESVQHVGPTAQDFYAAFGLGADDKSITTVDEGGVALAAIKGLALENMELKEKNEQELKELTELRERNEKELRGLMELRSEVAALKAQGTGTLSGDWAQHAVPLQWAAIAALAVMLVRRKR